MKIRSKVTQIAAGAALAGSALIVTAPAQATCVPDPYVGSVCMTAANFCPRNYAEAAGQILSISDNTTLFSLLGTTYGGNGVSTFGLPDLRGRSGIGQGQGPGLLPVVQGHTRGKDIYVATTATMANHTHTATFESSGGSAVSIPVSANSGSNVVAPDATNNRLSASPAGGTSAAGIWSSSTEQVATIGGVTGGGGSGTVTVEASGSSQQTTYYPPQLGMRFCVALQGMYPPRN